MLKQQTITKYKSQTNVTPSVDKIQKRIRLMRAHTSQLDNLISASSDTTNSFYEDMKEMYVSDKLQDMDSEKYKMFCTQIHQIHLKRISDFSIQCEIIAKFAPDLGEHLKGNIAYLKQATSDFVDMIKYVPPKDNKDEFPTNTWLADFGELLLDMQQTSDNIEIMLNVALDASESTLKFIEEKQYSLK